MPDDSDANAVGGDAVKNVIWESGEIRPPKWPRDHATPVRTLRDDSTAAITAPQRTFPRAT
ncbi:MAG: hypothetical protein IT581_01425 [Verrucomicrobiales bacterium]|nr:hypothetical protein [Verrucomicrobiales bacterium]